VQFVNYLFINSSHCSIQQIRNKNEFLIRKQILPRRLHIRNIRIEQYSCALKLAGECEKYAVHTHTQCNQTCWIHHHHHHHQIIITPVVLLFPFLPLHPAFNKIIISFDSAVCSQQKTTLKSSRPLVDVYTKSPRILILSKPSR
jgi:hypothetical protein